MQTQNRIFDEIAKLMTSAAGAAQGAAREMETLMRGQMERLVSELDLVPREEFEAMKALAQAARGESEVLAQRLDSLEARLSPRPARRSFRALKKSVSLLMLASARTPRASL